MLIREIEVFRLLMSSGSASKAANLLGVSQPAVSQSLQRFEQHAGFVLFNRVRGRLIATPEAHALLIEVERAFVGLSAIEHRIQSLKQFGVNTLRVCSYPAFGLGFVPRALARLIDSRRTLTQHPLVSLQIASSKEVREQVLAGHADFGLMAEEAATAGLEHSVFARFNGVVVMAPNNPLSRSKVITPKQLAKQPFLALNPEDTSRQHLDAVLASQDVQLRLAVETPYAASVCELAFNNLGIGVVNPMTAFDYAKRGLVIRSLAVNVPFTCQLVMPPGKVLSRVAQDFLKAMRIQLAADMKSFKQFLEITG